MDPSDVSDPSTSRELWYGDCEAFGVGEDDLEVPKDGPVPGVASNLKGGGVEDFAL